MVGVGEADAEADADAGAEDEVGEGVGDGFARAALAGRDEGFRTFWSLLRRGERKLEDSAGCCRRAEAEP